MHVIEQYILEYKYYNTILYKCENERWFVNKRHGNVGSSFYLTEIDEEEAMSLIKEQKEVRSSS